ncbi:DNA-binding MarR family transcriptional regulator [Amycolatopsis bartoniae]|uniref:MarR family transcriptional regulator n=1 Tax=Amycolatopsis bartoniae TaxID=941986 RepID=A0A8H9IZ73_9PSEU|nr:MarR family transcriptional regulator [Amycolatopsis bartoniae]MBB2937228.1 DNA-binding MarR family transcriptional regulator [Amycolatopsis bartoniae]TVT09488.1 MarR family transcriptional regulator [Amycolatopsis bartoniae]GHF53404.1 MarR family transcriptional regulator [Amycolatopsis bartoniae]
MSQGEILRSAGYLVKQVQQAFHRACEERLRPLGLSMSQYAVLRALADVPGASSAELARRTFVTRQSLRDVLAGLRAAGLVNVASRPTSGRALPVTLTEDGRSLLVQAQEIVLDVDDRMTAGLAPAEVRRLVSLLEVCAQNLG